MPLSVPPSATSDKWQAAISTNGCPINIKASKSTPIECNNQCNNQNKQTQEMTNANQQNRGHLSTRGTANDTHKQAGSRLALGIFHGKTANKKCPKPAWKQLRRFCFW